MIFNINRLILSIYINYVCKEYFICIEENRMRILITVLIACGLLFALFHILKSIKFDTVISISVCKGPLKGLSMKLIDYKVSYNDLQVKHKFWDSSLGKNLFYKLSTTLQALVLASKNYVVISFDVNYIGFLRRHYQVVEIDGQFDIISV
jgi:MFS superfamily sulfate permease-like transporter